MDNNSKKALIQLKKCHLNELYVLMNELESKNDPDPVEIKLFHNISEYLDRHQLLIKNIKTYSKRNGLENCLVNFETRQIKNYA